MLRQQAERELEELKRKVSELGFDEVPDIDTEIAGEVVVTPISLLVLLFSTLERVQCTCLWPCALEGGLGEHAC